MTEPLELFRCAGCGKWSHAKRRPVAHQRVHELDDETDEMRWCGPFVRYVATLDDPSPPVPSDRIGEALPDTERFTGEDPNAGIPPAHEVFR